MFVALVIVLSIVSISAPPSPPPTVGQTQNRLDLENATPPPSGIPVIQLNSDQSSYDGNPNNPVLLYWNVTNKPNLIYFTTPSTLGTVINNSSIYVTPAVTTTYTLNASSIVNGTPLQAVPVSITITSPAPPTIVSFTSNAPSTGIGSKTPVTFTWNVQLADSIQLSSSPTFADLTAMYDLTKDPEKAQWSLITSQLSSANPPSKVQVTLQASKGATQSAPSIIEVQINSVCPTIPSVPYNYFPLPFGSLTSYRRVAFSTAIPGTCPSVMYALSSNSNEVGIYASIDAFVVAAPVTEPSSGQYTNMQLFPSSPSIAYRDICVSGTNSDGSQTVYAFSIVQITQPSSIQLFSFAVSSPDVFNQYPVGGASPSGALPTATSISFTPTVSGVTASFQLNTLENMCLFDPTFLAANGISNASGLCLVGKYQSNPVSSPAYGVFALVPSGSGSTYQLSLFRTITQQISRYIPPTANDTNEYAVLFDGTDYQAVLVTPSGSATSPCTTTVIPSPLYGGTTQLADISTNSFQSICALNTGDICLLIGQPSPPYQFNFI